MPRDSLFPDDEPVGFQVWHKHGQHYEYVASVESNALGAMLMTTHGFMGHDRWQNKPRVASMPREHSSTTIGDVLIGRDNSPTTPEPANGQGHAREEERGRGR
jgi:hypothetical protein